MQAVDKSYLKELEAIVKAIQASDELKRFLDEEEDEIYNEMKDAYEPQLALLYNKIANTHPLQLVSFENALLESEVEGLFLPRILGYTVLRGYVDDNMKYIIPQDHFQNILLSICNSSNFDQIKQRIGQTIEVGFALSSDIWVTALTNQIRNKKVVSYLQSHKLMKYRNPVTRKIGYNRYYRQFKQENFLSADFPDSPNQIKLLYPGLKKFVVHRIMRDFDNSNIHAPILDFIRNEDFFGLPEHLELTMLYAGFFDLDKPSKAGILGVLNKLRKADTFDQNYLELLLGIYNSKIKIDKHFDEKMSELIDRAEKDEVSHYYDLTDIIHSKGYLDQDAVGSVEKFYNSREGLSLINRCVRRVISNYYDSLMTKLDPSQYKDMFETTNTYPLYMQVFGNEEFNHHLRGLSLGFVKRFLRVYKDKRGRDYQDLKKFVNATFLDLKFLTKKESVELFKTKRKKKVATTT